MHKQWPTYWWFLGPLAWFNSGPISDLTRLCGEVSVILEYIIYYFYYIIFNIFVVSEAPVEAPKIQKYENFQTYQQHYKTDEQKKEEVCVLWIFKFQFSLFWIGGSLISPRIKIIMGDSWLEDRPTFASNFFFWLHVWWAGQWPGAVRKDSWRINRVTSEMKQKVLVRKKIESILHGHDNLM